MTSRIKPAPLFRLAPGGAFRGVCDRVRIVRRTPDTGGPKGLALYTAVDGRKMAACFRPGDWT